MAQAANFAMSLSLARSCPLIGREKLKDGSALGEEAGSFATM